MFDPGTFCWAELATKDPGAAKRFYTSLFGWEAKDDPLPGGMTYTTLQLGGRAVGALYEMMDDERASGAPPGWLSYVSVADAAETAQKVKAAGGKICKDAF